MAGTGENELVMDEWRVSDPSPRTFFSNLMNGDLSSKPLFTDAGADNGGEVGITGPAKEDNETKEGVSRDHPCSEADVVSAQKPASRASLAERMAARTGFNAPKLNTDSIRSTSLPSPGARSPYLTIPPGLSPTTLLESPVFLCNSLTQQSPTTGKFPFGPFGDEGLLTSSYAFEKGKDSSLVAPVPFAFRPPPESSSLCFTNGENRIAAVPTTRHLSLPSIEVSVQSAGQIPNQNLSTTKTYSQNDHEFSSQQSLQITPSSKDINASSIPQNVVNNIGDSPPFDDEDDGDQKGEFSSQAVGAAAEDGYNWRKYGQKQVKGSEFPRSYYKCTHINCPVKKKVERSHEGHVTEIIYKGAHNHPKPTPNRRSVVGSYQTLDEGDNNNNVIQQSLDGEDAAWTPGQHGISNGMVDWMTNDGTTKGPSGSVSAEFCDPSLSIHGPGGLEIADARDVSSTMSNENDDDDRATNGSVSLGCEDEEEESESKRRKLDVCVSEISGATRAIREPRVVVQTTSEVDILDDGYRWRKYGQKVVKGNPNPRSYYKCTNAGCTVRKHVERASHDLKSVITTYEGKHNHDVPAARNSSQTNSTPSSAAPASSSSFVPRAEPSQTHGSLRMFDRSPILSSFNMHGRTQMTTPIPGYSFGMGQANLSSIAMAGLGTANHGKLPGFPMPHPYLGQQQHQQQQPLRKPNEWGLMMPKGEPNELPLESDLPVTNASAAYHQIMSRMALGPQL